MKTYAYGWSRHIHAGQSLNSSITTSGCSEEPEQHVDYLEHVVVKVLIAHPRRGDLEINLISPSGTRSQLLAKRWEWYCLCTDTHCRTSSVLVSFLHLPNYSGVSVFTGCLTVPTRASGTGSSWRFIFGVRGQRAHGLWRLLTCHLSHATRRCWVRSNNSCTYGNIWVNVYIWSRYIYLEKRIIIIIVILYSQLKRMDPDPPWHISESLPAPQCSALPFKNVGDPSPRCAPGGARARGGGGGGIWRWGDL